MRRIAVGLALVGAIAAGLDDAAFATDLSLTPTTPTDDRARAISCMSAAILYEAGFESGEGREAVAEVILNRLHNPGFPKTVCGVVFQGSKRSTGCQFTFTCDGSLRRTLPTSVVERAQEVATRAIDGLLVQRVAGATHYHANYVAPYWAPSLIRVASIGTHIFYRQPGAETVSSLAAFRGSGEALPAGLTAPSQASIMATAADKPKERAEFRPWGLSPIAYSPGSKQ